MIDLGKKTLAEALGLYCNWYREKYNVNFASPFDITADRYGEFMQDVARGWEPKKRLEGGE